MNNVRIADCPQLQTDLYIYRIARGNLHIRHSIARPSSASSPILPCILPGGAATAAGDLAMTISARMPSTAAWSLKFLVLTTTLVAPMVMHMVVAKSTSTAHVSQDTEGCLSVDEAVFPAWAPCTDGPARYAYAGGSYYVALALGAQMHLEPEWDESNSTYYIRLSYMGNGRYGFTHLMPEWRSAVLLNQTFYITNLDTGRNLAWREEGGERFLVETDYANGSLFRFSRVSGSQTACPRILGLLCLAYNILTADSSSSSSELGLAAYIEDGSFYFREQSDDLFPFSLFDSSTYPSDAMAIASVPNHRPLH